MEPTTISAITAAIIALATEISKGAASEAGKEAWYKLKELLGRKPIDSLDKAQTEVTECLEANPELLKEVLSTLKTSQSVNVDQLVNSITAEKVIVAGSISGDIEM